MTIFKIQKAIHPPGAPYLIYDQKREIMLSTLDFSEEIEDALAGRLKVYVEATYDDGNFHILYEVDNPRW